MAVAPLQPTEDPRSAASFTDVARLLCAARRFLGLAGGAFLLWKLEGVFRRRTSPPGPAALCEVFVVSLLGPALVWFTGRWAEHLARKASRDHRELVFLHRLAEQEIAERRRAEAALAGANARLEARVAARTPPPPAGWPGRSWRSASAPAVQVHGGLRGPHAHDLPARPRGLPAAGRHPRPRTRLSRVRDPDGPGRRRHPPGRRARRRPDRLR